MRIADYVGNADKYNALVVGSSPTRPTRFCPYSSVGRATVL